MSAPNPAGGGPLVTLGPDEKARKREKIIDVLWDLQGVQKAVFRTETGPDGNPHEVFDGFELVHPGRLSPEEFDDVASDLTAFLTYISEPVQLQRQSLGIKVILFLVVLFLFAFLFKKELWKDVR